MAHIVIDARGLFTTTGRYTRKLIEHLARQPDDNVYTVVLPHDRLREWTPPAPRFRAVGTTAPSYSLAEQTTFAAELRALSPDLVHFGMPQQPLVLGAPRITTFHDLTILKIHNRKKAWYVSVAKRLIGAAVFFVAARRGRVSIVPSRFSGDELRRFALLRGHRIALTYEAADEIADPAEAVAIPFPRFVLFVGNQVPYKNLPRLIEAVRRLRERDPAIGLVVAGRIDGDGEMLRAASTGIDEHCHFTGFVSDGQLRWLYENAGVLAFPSFYEGFGLPGLEAMIHGCPVASSTATCLPEIYGDAAVYFDPSDVEEMSRALAHVLDDEELRAGLVARGRARAREYSWDRMARQTLRAYSRALGAG